MVVSSLSLGASSLGGVFRETQDQTSAQLVEEAVRQVWGMHCTAAPLHPLLQGINYIDTAPWYGHGRSEEVLGRALQSVPRQAYYIATKVG